MKYPEDLEAIPDLHIDREKIEQAIELNKMIIAFHKISDDLIFLAEKAKEMSDKYEQLSNERFTMLAPAC